MNSTTQNPSTIFPNKAEIDAFVQEAEARIRVELHNVETDAELLLADLSDFGETTSFLSRKEVQVFKSRADEIGARLVSLKEKTASSMDSLLARSPDSFYSYSKSQLSGHPWVSTRAIPMLSEIYLKIRCLYENDASNANQVWVPPSVFDRSTHKYWLTQNNLTEVMLKCLEEVPLLVYGKDPSEISSISSEEDIWDTISSSISSIYFDSPETMVLYKDRIARVESAQLFRIRWYGNKPSDHELIFLELKTHHECWVGAKSVKERVALKACDLSEVLLRDGRQWSEDTATEKVKNAKPKATGKELEDAVNLLLRIRKLVIKKNLQPRVRSSYRRVAFQSNTNNDLRFTIDRDIELSSEEGAPLGAWCRHDDVKAKPVMMPVGVFEVKLGGVEAPKWVDTLLGKGIIQDGHKFSKYLSGASILFEKDVKTLPYWSQHPLFLKYYYNIDDDTEANCKDHSLDKSEITRLSLESETDSFLSNDKKGIFKNIAFHCVPRGKKHRMVAPKNRARIEPKTYFAAERTFIQWISAALLLVTVSALLFTLAETHADNGSKINAKILLVVALFLALYALGVYFRRLHLMKNSKPYGYTDHLAPIILTLAIVTGIGSILYHALPSNSIRTVRESEGQCHRVPYSGISLLEFQPSDITIDSTRNSAIVPSNNQIIAINLGSGEHEVHSLSSLEFGDFEATVLVGDILFAVSEYSIDEPSKLFAFEMIGSNKPKAELLGSWKLADSVKGSESIAHREVDGKGQLLISSYDALINVSQIHIFEMPQLDFNDDLEGSKLHPISRLNEKIMSAGIEETKISSMQVFEDTLHVLYDNAMMIRSFDLYSGEMKGEIKLPSVGISYDKQWEGLFFERLQSSQALDGGNLRGSSAKEGVVLHLALDSPPQIWKFFMNEEKDGAFTFPKCAAA
jgi:uncharacterized membrane protein YidH (DUF202 family)